MLLERVQVLNYSLNEQSWVTNPGSIKRVVGDKEAYRYDEQDMDRLVYTYGYQKAMKKINGMAVCMQKCNPKLADHLKKLKNYMVKSYGDFK
jgi:hypothetical protein